MSYIITGVISAFFGAGVGCMAVCLAVIANKSNGKDFEIEDKGGEDDECG